MDIRTYDVNKRLNHTDDHPSMKGFDVIEFHLNAYNGKAKGTEILLKAGLYADSMDKVLLEVNGKYFTNRGFVARSNLYNMNYFAKLGISYRLIEVCFIDNVEDMNVFDSSFDSYITDIANAIKATYTKPVMLVAGHGAGDPGAGGNGREEATEVRRIVNAVYSKLVEDNTQPQPQPTPTPLPTPVPSEIKVGDTIRIEAPYNKYIADDVQTKYGIVQIRENVLAGGQSSFAWDDNGIPEQCVDLTNSNGVKRADSDRVHPRTNDYFVFNTHFKVIKRAIVNGKPYLQLDFNGKSKYRFWVIEQRCQKV